MEKSKKVLLINTHLTYPGWTEGKLNNSFIQIAKDFFEGKSFEVLETKVENGYNPEEEVEKHLQADIILLQTPVNWFGAPWIYKKYVDEVFNVGMLSKKLLNDDGRTKEDPYKQYGSGGKMQGKKFMISATWNAPKECFDNPAQDLFKGKSTADIFLNISSNYSFCGCDVLPDYNCFDIYKNGDMINDLKKYPEYLAKTFNL
jgi:modulator of drug activity B